MPQPLLQPRKSLNISSKKAHVFVYYAYYLEDNIWTLHHDLISGNYTHSDYKYFCISDTKKRSIHNALMRDKVVHRVLFNSVHHAIEENFIFHSYSSIKNKGSHKMLNYINKCAKNIFYNKQCFILHLDVRKYFESIDHTILKEILNPYLKNKELIFLTNQIIDSFCYSKNKGIPLGNITSQLFANLYLSDLDWFSIRNLGCEMYARYNDDIFIVHSDKLYLENVSTEIADWVKQNRLLEIPNEKINLHKYLQKISVLGYIVSPDEVLIKNFTKQRIFENISDKNSASYFGLLSHCKDTVLNQKVRSVYESDGLDFMLD